jgi:hypothetical protein
MKIAVNSWVISAAHMGFLKLQGTPRLEFGCRLEKGKKNRNTGSGVL